MRLLLGLATAFIGCWALSTATLAATVRIVQDRDEPGRNPYQVHVIFPADCGAYDCTIVFRKYKKKGKLVIEHVSCRIASPSTYPPFEVFLAGKSGDVYLRTYLPFEYQGANSGVNSYIINTPVLFYYDTGDRPTIDIYRSGSPPAAPSGDCALSGYRVKP